MLFIIGIVMSYLFAVGFPHIIVEEIIYRRQKKERARQGLDLD